MNSNHATIPTTPITSYDLLCGQAQKNGNKTAIRFIADVSNPSNFQLITYTELLNQVNQAINLFSTSGISLPVISYILPNMPETVVIWLAAQAIGIANPISPGCSQPQIRGLINQAKSNFIIIPKAMPNLIESSAHPNTEFLSLESFTKKRNDMPTKLKGSIPSSKNRICAYYHTSGTTGDPELTRQTVQGQYYSAITTNIFLRIRDTDRLLLPTPFFHVAAPGLTLCALFSGAEIILASPFGWMDRNLVNHFWEIVSLHKATLSVGLGPHIQAITSSFERQSSVNKTNNTLRVMISGMLLNPQVLTKFENATGARVAELYGATESTFVFSLSNLKTTNEPGTHGSILPGSEARVVLLDKNGLYHRDAQANEAGFFAFRGPAVQSSPYVSEKTTLLSWLEIDGQHWLVMPDIVKINDGIVTVLSRGVDMIHSKNGMWNPNPIESLLNQHPDISISAVLGGPDEENGEVAQAFIQLKPGANFNQDKLVDYLTTNHIPALQIPSRFIVIEKMPLNAMSKPIKFELQTKAYRDDLENKLQTTFENFSLNADNSLLELTLLNDRYGMNRQVNLILQIDENAEFNEQNADALNFACRQVLSQFNIDLNIEIKIGVKLLENRLYI